MVILNNFSIMWYGFRPSEDVCDLVKKDLSELFERGLDRPSDLILHHVQLTKDMYGPSVHVWGEKDDDVYFHCEYVEKTEWVTHIEEAE